MTDLVPSGRPDVELRLPADRAYASVLRTTTAGLAARLDFTIEDIEDLRMAVGEASALVLEHARAGDDLTGRFWLGQGNLVITLSAPSSATEPPAEDTFAWQVLATLASEARADLSASHLQIALIMHSETTV